MEILKFIEELNTLIGICSVEHSLPFNKAAFTASTPSKLKHVTSMSDRILSACGVSFFLISSSNLSLTSGEISHSSKTVGSLKEQCFI